MSDMTIQHAIHCMKAMICEEVCEECDYYGKTGTDHCEADAVRMAIKALEEQPQWIPCSERLPEANGRYFVTRGLNACGAMWNRVYIINYSDLMGLKSERIWWDGNVGKSDFERFDDVIAWMQLPEPYGGESE